MSKGDGFDFLNRLGLKLRLFGILVVLAGLFAWMSYEGISGMSSSHQALLELSAKAMQAVDTARSAQVHFKKQVQEWKNILIRGNDPALFEKYRNKFFAEETKVREILAELRGQLQADGADVSAVDSLLAEHETLGRKYRDALRSYDPQRLDSFQVVDRQVRGIDRAPTREMDRLVESIHTQSTDQLSRMDRFLAADNEQIRRLFLVAAVVFLVLIVATMVWLMHAVLTPLGRLNKSFEAIGNGDFSERIDIPCKDEVGDLVCSAERMRESLLNSFTDVSRVLGAIAQGDLTEQVSAEYRGAFARLKQDVNAATERLTQLITQIKSTADSVHVGAREIAQGNTDLAQRTEEQASNLERTAASMEQMTSSVKQNAGNAQRANELASNTREQAMQGGNAVREAVSAMEMINDSSKKIADIIVMIDEIASQTNLLALNAAIEAARAGEAGHGFAVVADEVRDLAQRSARAANEIKELIQDTVAKVEEGSRLVDASGKSLQEIVAAVKDVSDIVSDIALASQEQSVGIDEVNRAVAQIDEITQQNAALVQEVATASETMGDQVQSLSALLERFKVDPREGAVGLGEGTLQVLDDLEAARSVA